MIGGMPRLVQLPPELRTRPFPVDEAARAGIRSGRLRSNDVDAPFAAVRVSDEMIGPVDPAELFAVRMSPRQFFSHVTAARLHGLPLPPRHAMGSDLDVAVEIPNQCPRMPGVRGHRLTPGSVSIVEVGSLRVASPVDTWRQMSTLLTVDDLVVVGDALVRRNKPLATLPELRAAVVRHGRHRGARRLREALESVRPRVDSPNETQLRLILVRNGLPEPVVNGIIVDSAGTQLATGDLVYREYRVLVEYDGEQHRTDQDQYNWDIDRLDRIRDAGWRVVRVNRSHMAGNAVLAVRKVEAALRAAGWRP